MADICVGAGELRFDREDNKFTGKLQLAPFEYPIEMRPVETKDGLIWRMHAFEGKPYGPYRIPVIDGE